MNTYKIDVNVVDAGTPSGDEDPNLVVIRSPDPPPPPPSSGAPTNAISNEAA